MPGLHLNHYVSWDDLLEELCYVYDDPGIKLPICECGRIQASEKKVQHQIKNRKYLDDKICTSADCKIVGEKIFRKSEKRKLKLPQNLYMLHDEQDKPNITRFIDNFKRAIKEFAESERKKIVDRNVPKEKDIKKHLIKNIINELKQKMLPFEWDYYRWDLVSLLTELEDSKMLLSLPNKYIMEDLQHYESQAIGNNLKFLASRLFKVYLYTNLIIAAGLEDKPDEWGPMKPDPRGFRQGLMRDWDGQAFLYFCRKYLTDEIYMKDFNAMKELCKKCFQFLYFLEMLGNEVGYENKMSKFLFDRNDRYYV